jgi:hypothetical protein
VPDFSLSKGTPIEIALSPDGRQFALASRTGLSLWDANGHFVESHPTDMDVIKDIRFTVAGKRLLVCTKKGIYSWFMLQNLIAQMNNALLDSHTIKQQVQRELSEFNGKVIYTFSDTIFLRKALIFFYLMFIGLTFIHEMVEYYDEEKYLKLAYFGAGYGFLLLTPIALFELVSTRGDIIMMANGSLISLCPVFLFFIRKQALLLKSKGRMLWVWVHLSMGVLGTAAFIAFVVSDLLSFLNYTMLAMTLIIAFMVLMVRIPSHYAAKSWYAGKKWQFYAWSVLYGIIMLFSVLLMLAFLLG